jgi:hypothetical protein
MNPWWAPESSDLVLWLCLVGPLDGLLGWIASRGLHRRAFFAVWTGILILYGVIGIGGVLGLVLGQPPYIWVPLTTVGLAIAWLQWRLMEVMKYAYQQAELRRSIARDL